VAESSPLRLWDRDDSKVIKAEARERASVEMVFMALVKEALI